MGRCNGRETRTGTRHPADQYLSGKGVDDGWLGVLDNSGNEKNNNCVFVVKRFFGAQKDQSPPLLLKHFGGERKKKGQTTQRYKRLESRGANELPTQQLISISFSSSTLNTSKQVSISQNATRQTSQTRLATTLPQACKALRLFLPKSRPSVNQIMQLLSRHKCALNTHTRTHARAYIPCHLVVILAVIVWPFRF